MILNVTMKFTTATYLFFCYFIFNINRMSESISTEKNNNINELFYRTAWLGIVLETIILYSKRLNRDKIKKQYRL